MAGQKLKNNLNIENTVKLLVFLLTVWKKTSGVYIQSMIYAGLPYVINNFIMVWIALNLLERFGTSKSKTKMMRIDNASIDLKTLQQMIHVWRTKSVAFSLHSTNKRTSKQLLNWKASSTTLPDWLWQVRTQTISAEETVEKMIVFPWKCFRQWMNSSLSVKSVFASQQLLKTF